MPCPWGKQQLLTSVFVDQAVFSLLYHCNRFDIHWRQPESFCHHDTQRLYSKLEMGKAGLLTVSTKHSVTLDPFCFPEMSNSCLLFVPQSTSNACLSVICRIRRCLPLPCSHHLSAPLLVDKYRVSPLLFQQKHRWSIFLLRWLFLMYAYLTDFLLAGLLGV